jgi:hypothetical protein
MEHEMLDKLGCVWHQCYNIINRCNAIEKNVSGAMPVERRLAYECRESLINELGFCFEILTDLQTDDTHIDSLIEKLAFHIERKQAWIEAIEKRVNSRTKPLEWEGHE